jgi:hypothetical protein
MRASTISAIVCLAVGCNCAYGQAVATKGQPLAQPQNKYAAVFKRGIESVPEKDRNPHFSDYDWNKVAQSSSSSMKFYDRYMGKEIGNGVTAIEAVIMPADSDKPDATETWIVIMELNASYEYEPRIVFREQEVVYASTAGADLLKRKRAADAYQSGWAACQRAWLDSNGDGFKKQVTRTEAKKTKAVADFNGDGNESSKFEDGWNDNFAILSKPLGPF